MDSESSSHQIEVTVDAAGWRSAVTGPETICRSAVTAAIEAARPRAGGLAVTVLLADDATIQALNRTWRGKDRPTNVLSFPAGPPPAGLPRNLRWPLGDLALALETSASEAAEEGKTLAQHLAHLVVHGTLHLLGYDHETPAEAEAMEALERRILAGLGVPDPYRAEITA
jgi:probable rRNA maturation factor